MRQVLLCQNAARPLGPQYCCRYSYRRYWREVLRSLPLFFAVAPVGCTAVCVRQHSGPLPLRVAPYLRLACATQTVKSGPSAHAHHAHQAHHGNSQSGSVFPYRCHALPCSMTCAALPRWCFARHRNRFHLPFFSSPHFLVAPAAAHARSLRLIKSGPGSPTATSPSSNTCPGSPILARTAHNLAIIWP